jgi:D-aspartate ligase
MTMRPQHRDPGLDTTTPVLLLGGAANALSLMRSFGRLGIRGGAIMRAKAELRSRYCRSPERIPDAVDAHRYYRDRLLTADRLLPGAVIFACGDDAVEFVAQNHGALEGAGYILERNDPELRLLLLDKARTLELAHDAGLPTPRYWLVDGADDWEGTVAAAEYPLILKPLDTHRHHARFGHKFRVAATPESLIRHRDALAAEGMPFMLCELVPGPDRNHVSYYTYRDEDGNELLHFTKRCLRRRPMNEGIGTYQITENLPDVEALGKRFFAMTRYTGFGNLELKRDERTGELKILECNTRFTAVQEQLLASGVNSDIIVYRDLTGQRAVPTCGAEQDVAIWWPFRDVQAFAVARASTRETWGDWRRSLSHRRVVFPYFQASDPAPFVSLIGGQLDRAARKVAGSVGRRTTPGVRP